MSRELRDLLAGLLDKDPTRRMGLHEVKAHPWVTRNGALTPIKSSSERRLTRVFESVLRGSASPGGGGSGGGSGGCSGDRSPAGTTKRSSDADGGGGGPAAFTPSSGCGTPTAAAVITPRRMSQVLAMPWAAIPEKETRAYKAGDFLIRCLGRPRMYIYKRSSSSFAPFLLTCWLQLSFSFFTFHV